MIRRDIETTSRLGFLNGLMTVATKPWRNGLQINNHPSNATVFPTISTAGNTSPTLRRPITDNAIMVENQQIRLQEQRNQDHRLNVLWYGGDNSLQQQQQISNLPLEPHHRYQPQDDSEKQPLRQKRRQFQQTKHRKQKHKNKQDNYMVPVIWATILHLIYTTTMAIVFYTYSTNIGSGWVWLKGITNCCNNPLSWLCYLSPTWYYAFQASCSTIIGCFGYRWSYQRLQRQQWYCYLLLALFSTTLLPSIPFIEIFNVNNGVTTIAAPLENSTSKPHHSIANYDSGVIDDNRLALFEGLWQVLFFIFVAYCLVLPTNLNEHLKNEKNNDHQNSNSKDVEDNLINVDSRVTKVVLLFAFVFSFGHIILNMFTAYHWYFQPLHHQNNNLMPSMVAIRQQLIANTVLLICINLIGWVLRNHLNQDRAEISGHNVVGQFKYNYKELCCALKRQIVKLNLLLSSLLPKRVFMQMKYDIVVDTAHSQNVTFDTNNDEHLSEVHLQQSQQELKFQTSLLSRMYLKEYKNVSILYATVNGIWNSSSIFAYHDKSNALPSFKFTTVVDQLLANLFYVLARRNRCVPIRILGNRVFFIAGLPAEETFEYGDSGSQNNRYLMDSNGHTRDAIQMGLDLINAVKTINYDVNKCQNECKFDLNIRVGVHSGQITCGVQGFIESTNIRSKYGSLWQYNVWGHDVQIALNIESNGLSSQIHISNTTFDQFLKKKDVNAEVNHSLSRVDFCNINYCSDSCKNKNGYTIKPGYKNLKDQFLIENRINTHFIVPCSMCLDLKINENSMTSHNNVHRNYNKDKDIESLVLQSIQHQLQKEELQWQYIVANITETEITSDPMLPTVTPAVLDLPVMTAALVSAAPITTVMMKMNRHRRSRVYEQELQPLTEKLNTSSNVITGVVNRKRWAYEVFTDYEKDDQDKNNDNDKPDDDDLFRLVKSHLLLLCLIITLFVVNMTTMPWTLLLGITFIIPFVVISGKLIYVMALLIDWISRPKFQSNAYSAEIIADDDEYYHHYDSDYYNDSDSDSGDDSGCLRNVLTCYGPNGCSLIARLFKIFKNNDEESSMTSTDESDFESKLGFRNENAALATTSGLSQQNRFHYSQPINRNYNSNQFHQLHKRSNHKYQNEKRRTRFFWLSACCEMFVVLLVCLLALLNALTCEPTSITTRKIINDQFNIYNTNNNNSGEFNTISQQYRNPLMCLWPQYAVLTCCLACVSIAIAFPVYYGALPTLRMKTITLLVMIFVFAVAFVHFTHRHIFIAALVSSSNPTYCNDYGKNLDNQIINTTNTNNKDDHQTIDPNFREDSYKDQQLRRLQNQEQQRQRVIGLNTTMATIYVVMFVIAILMYSIYAHSLQNLRARYRFKVDRIKRRISVLREAHRRTLHTVIPDDVADSLRNSCSYYIIDTKEKCNETRPLMDAYPSEKQITYMLPPLYHHNYKSLAIIFVTVVQKKLSTNSSENDYEIDNVGYDCEQNLALLQDIFGDFDMLLYNTKYQGLVRKIKLVDTNTYMVAIGLQPQYESDCLLGNQHKESRRKNNTSCQYNYQNRRNSCNSSINNKNLENTNGHELYDVISANYVIIAIDLVRDLRSIMHQKLTPSVTSIGYLYYSQPKSFALRAGISVGPAVVGLIGCNDKIWKRPQFDVWGSTVNEARKMNLSCEPGLTRISKSVVEVLKYIKDSEYTYNVHNDQVYKGNENSYYVHEHFESHANNYLVQQQELTRYNVGLHRQVFMIKKNPHNQLQSDQQLEHKHSVAGRPSRSVHHISPQLDREHPSSTSLISEPTVTIHAQHSHYSAGIYQDRNKYLEKQKTPPPPPPRSPPPVNIEQMQTAQHSILQNSCNSEHQPVRGTQLLNGSQQPYSQKCRTPNTISMTSTTYARPMQQHHKKNNQHSTKSGVMSIPQGLVRIFDGHSQQSSPQYAPYSTNPLLTHVPDNIKEDSTIVTPSHSQQQQPRRPNKLSLRNITTAGMASIKFNADRPLPAPPRSSDTVAGRQRPHHEPRRRRRPHNQTLTTTKQQLVQPDINNDQCSMAPSTAWPSSFRSQINSESFISTSSLSSSGSTDAGDTTTSNNNYNSTTSTSSSEDSFGPSNLETCGEINKVDIDDFDTNVSSAAVSPIHNRYRNQQRLLLRQWSPSTTVNSSPVKRSSSFRSPLSGSENTAVSSSSLRSPPIVGNINASNFSGTQSLNRRRIRPTITASNSGNNSSRRRRRRQQQQSNLVTAEQSTPPSDVLPDKTVTINTTANTVTEKHESPTSSSSKKQQRRQVIVNKDQGTSGSVVGPDFTDEIRRILSLDQHRSNIRQQQREICEKGIQVNKLHNDKEINVDNVISFPSPSIQNRAVEIVTDTKSKKVDLNNRKREKDGSTVSNQEPIITSAIAIANNLPSTSSFEERERQITEQVKRQEAEVRRILQEHKNNVAAVVKGITAVTTEPNRRRITAVTEEFSEWSDDESIGPSLSLLGNGHREQCNGLVENVRDYNAIGNVMTVDTKYMTDGEGDGYTTGGDTVGYTTDETAATTDAPYSRTTNLTGASTARNLDDNLSILNDTGLTDAEAALSDVNSLILYNDCYDNNRSGRRQSSLSSRYASDSYCDDDDEDFDDDYLTDNNELYFQERSDLEDDEQIYSYDDRDNGRRCSLIRIMQQQQQQLLSLQQALSSIPSNDYDDNCPKSSPQQQSVQQTPSQANVGSTTKNIVQSPIAAVSTAAITQTSHNSPIATHNSINNTTSATTDITTTSTNTNTEFDKPQSSSSISKDNLNK